MYQGGHLIMLKKRRNFLLLLMLLALSLVLAACAGGSDGEESSDGSDDSTEKTDNESEGNDPSDFVIATISDAAKLDPHMTTDVPSYNIITNLFETLVKKDENEEIIEGLATSWDNPDDKTWVFELRDDVQFHDGEAFNAEAVKKNFERILDEELAAPRAFIFEVISDIEVLDEHTVQFTTEYPFAPLLAHLTHPVGSIISPKSIDEDYAAIEDGKEVGTVINDEPIGTGYFKFDSWDRGTEVKIVRNDDYWGEQVNLNSVTFKAIPDGGTRLAELETGYAHLIEPVQPSEVGQIEASDNAYMDDELSSSLNYVGFNLEKEPFNDPKVRQAITMLINKDEMLEGIYEGFGLVAKGPLAPGVFGYDENLEALSYDPEKALELLAEAGYEDGFKTTVWTNDNQQRMDMAVLIQDSLKEANIEVEVEVVEWGAYLDKTANGEHDMFILGLTNPVGDADYFLSQLFHSENKGASGNRSFYENAEVDQLLEEARAEGDEEKRQQLYTEIQEILIEDAPMIYLQHQSYLSGVNHRVENYWINPSGYYMLQDITIKE